MFEIYLVSMILIPASAFPLIKYSVIACFLGVSFFQFLKSTIVSKNVFLYLFGLMAVLFFALLGFVMNNEVEYVFKESVSYIIFLAALFCLIKIYPLRIKSSISFICFGFFMYLLGKLVIFFAAASFTNIASSLTVYHAIKEYVPAAVVSSFAAGGTPRIVFANDYLLPIFLFWLVCMNYYGLINNRRFYILGALSIVVIMLSLSRYLYLQTGMVVFLAAVLRFKARSVVQYSLLLFLLSLAFPYLLSLVGYSDLFQDRVFGDVAAKSNSVKFDQLEVMKHFYESPIVGKGLGLELEISGRELRNPFQSEVQWIGLLAKTGLLGLLLLIILLLRISMLLLSTNRVLDKRINYIIIFVLLIWLSAGFTNPVLFLTSSTINYLLLYSIWLGNKNSA